MSKLRVLIADDSELIQSVLSEIFSSDEGIQVVDVAGNGLEALEKVRHHKPDIATIDINMPVMGGLEAIENIMSECAIPILVISDVSDSKAAFTALSSGALDVISKKDISSDEAHTLLRKVKLLSKVKVIRHLRKRPTTQITTLPQHENDQRNHQEKVVAIACSTGGPKALSTILGELKSSFPYPILVAQHIEDGFIEGLVEWMNNVSRLNVKIGIDGERLEGGSVYIAPTLKHMEISLRGRIRLIDRNQFDIYRPSCNKLLSSVALAYKENSIGVILTGMGNDGVDGLEEIKIQQGHTIAQDQITSVVFGMPNEAIKKGIVDKVMPLGEIARLLREISEKSRVLSTGV